jgi:molybdenum-dependent DNA-binding transcriptional regulator ModE
LHELGGRATIAELAAAMGVAFSVAWSVVREMTALSEIEEIAATQEGEGSGRRAPTYRLRQPPNIYVS